MNPFLLLPGAVQAEGQTVAAHYGQPLEEQRALHCGQAVADLSHRGVLTVSGEQRLTWLHSMTSQHVSDLGVGESAETLLLDPHGRIEYAIGLVDDGERSWLLVDEGCASSLCEFLNRMRFALRVEVHDVSSEYVTVLAFEGEAAEALRTLDRAVAQWRDPWAQVQPGGVQYARGAHPGVGWNAVQFVYALSDIAAVCELFDGHGDCVRPAGLLAVDALEVRAWRPTLHGEVDSRAIPHEFDWLRTAVHVNKGCYRGQETVAKVHNLGHPPRRLVMLHLDGSSGELPGAGAGVYRAGEARVSGSRAVGRVTRSVLHYEWGGVALALLRRSVDERAVLEVRTGGDDASSGSGEVIAATQEVIVPADAGAVRRERIASLLNTSGGVRGRG